MNDSELRDVLVHLLGDVVPELDPATLDPDVDLRDQLDVDSMDLLHFLLNIDKELHVDVPESDYGKVSTLNKCAAYVRAHLPAEGDSAPMHAVAAAPALVPSGAGAGRRSRGAKAAKPTPSEQDGTYPRLYARLQGLLGGLQRELPEPVKAFAQLHRQTVASGALEAKTKELMALAIGIALRCNGCVAYHVHDALRAGASRQEVLETIGVALMMGGGPALVYGAEAFEALGQFEAAGLAAGEGG